jgi:hypothetical protein
MIRRLIPVLAALALNGCGTCQKHANACAAVAFVAVSCGTLILHNHHSARSPDRLISDPSAPACGPSCR